VPDVTRNLWLLHLAYQKRYTRGMNVISIFIAGLYPMTNHALWAVLLFCVVPCLGTLPFMVLGFAERFAKVPPDVEARAKYQGVHRKRLEYRHHWVERIWVAEHGCLK
jgi:hypothetical protein